MRLSSGHRSALTAASLGTIALAACNKTPTPAAAPAPVRVAVAGRGDVPVATTGLGRVQGFYTAVARAQTSGVVTGISFTEGQSVQAGQPLAQIDPRPLEATLAQSAAALARDRAALAGARDLLSRSAPLVAQGLASAQQVEAYRAQVEQLVASVAGDRAAVARDRLMLAYATIRAPISGTTGVRTIDPGNLVSPTDQLGIVTIAQIQPITAVFAVAQSELPGIRQAMAHVGNAGLRIEALAPGGSSVLDVGRLVAVNNQIDEASGTVRLKAEFPNSAKRLWPGQQVTARLVLGQLQKAVTVPASAVQRNPTGSFVWLVDGSGAARIQLVRLGTMTGDRVVVTQGLKGGERVVTDGQFGLVPGRRVNVIATAVRDTSIKSDDSDRLGLSL